MARTVAGVILAVAMGCAALGCGTVGNLQSERCSPFGGVAEDVGACQEIGQNGFNPGSAGSVPGGSASLVGVFCCRVLDIPLSFVGDVLTLPWTLTSHHGNSGPGEPPLAQ